MKILKVHHFLQVHFIHKTPLDGKGYKNWEG
jgi:hypothetical protein